MITQHMKNVWDTAKAVFRGKCIASSASIMKLETCYIVGLSMHVKELEKQ